MALYKLNEAVIWVGIEGEIVEIIDENVLTVRLSPRGQIQHFCAETLLPMDQTLGSDFPYMLEVLKSRKIPLR